MGDDNGSAAAEEAVDLSHVAGSSAIFKFVLEWLLLDASSMERLVVVVVAVVVVVIVERLSSRFMMRLQCNGKK